MKAQIVIGLGYGDEGKGITTDYLCSQHENSIVVRFSGGQQAGHTVIKDGIKHTHSNFGAGTLRGVKTYFSEHATIYPATIMRERKVLLDKGVVPQLILHPLAHLTTPFDVFANRQDDKNLSDGTCGLGIGKTMHRNLHTPYKLYAIDLMNPEVLLQKLDIISQQYYKFHMNSLTQAQINEIDEFVMAVVRMDWNIQNYNYLSSFGNIIFEGSQGILLDMDHGVYPNVTYSNTTSKNAHKICDKLNIRYRETFYITRAYHTRHGSGAFTHEELNLVNNSEEINVNNNYQKEFKTAKLNYDLLNHALRIDNIYCKSNVKNLVVTCNDQIETPFQLQEVETIDDFRVVYYSSSPESKDFRQVNI